MTLIKSIIRVANENNNYFFLAISSYDHHSFWLDCCIGETNQVFFMVGLSAGILALVYGSLLTLTTVCRPVFKYGILVPSDCSDVTDDLE